ncbi:MAG: MATE family efflux transporter [Defluviitaleaceae bacterium]|nr:MATE family efflux transporter [Defluviitaleaceae bacterium]
MMGRQEIKSRSRELFSISMPMMVEHLFISIMGMISTVLVSSIGEHATSALGMVDSISNLIIALFVALTTGGTIVVAQYIGSQDIMSAKRAAGQAIVLSAIFSAVVLAILLIFRIQILDLLFGDAEADVMASALTFLFIISFSFPVLAIMQTIFGILRGSGDTLTPMIVSIGMNVINLILGIILINGLNLGFFAIPALGVAGAAIALVVARVMGLGAAIYFIVKKARGVRLNKLRFFKPAPPMQKTILKLGLPTSFESSLFQMGRLVTQVFIVSISTAAIATNTIAGSVANFINVPGMALATGVMILVGQRIGRGNIDDVKRTAIFATIASSVLFLGLSIILFFTQSLIFAPFNPSEEALAYLPMIFVSYLIATPLFWATSFVIPAALRATGDVMFPMIVSITTMLVLRVAFSYIFAITLGMGIMGIWLAMYLDWVGRSALFIPRMLGNKWKGKGIKAPT